MTLMQTGVDADGGKLCTLLVTCRHAVLRFVRREIKFEWCGHVQDLPGRIWCTGPLGTIATKASATKDTGRTGPRPPIRTTFDKCQSGFTHVCAVNGNHHLAPDGF